MSSTQMARRYWDALIRVGNATAGTPRARAGYTLRQRWWASLTGYRLPIRNKPTDTGPPCSE
jgi:hypothetical protein